MGEAKRRQLVDDVTKKLVDDGKLVEGGWQAFRVLYLPQDVSRGQLNDMRIAFFAGAHHLFASVLTFLESGDDATEADLRRLDALQQELDAFVEEFKLRVTRKG